MGQDAGPCDDVGPIVVGACPRWMVDRLSALRPRSTLQCAQLLDEPRIVGQLHKPRVRKQQEFPVELRPRELARGVSKVQLVVDAADPTHGESVADDFGYAIAGGNR